ncbi:LPXTG-motif protein cell wall anchor domain protein [Lentilactobacillus parafarraginis F0439]|uniref:LPXTG-motif protein cell wall anchor domain protein n=1 Tax=Lentilactobacillus parafarraginis F0439 TaxID=797515 RepID=G9ZNB4_9LACO|nr:MucBP domain-containing protein [Lentilactobacillus parafarraginis]EHL98993.1 LPXTG-motif protein cell wall anchor domain protein [Lentilactobacillus parafarraginis F0439]
MKLVTDSKTGLPITEDGAGWKGVQANPKVSSFVNKDGLTVTKLDYTGTGFDWTPINQNMQVSFQVDSDAVSSFVPWNSSTAREAGNFDGVSYVDTKDFSNSGLTASNNAATKFGTSGESVAVVMVQGNQLSNAMQTSQADLQNLYIETADGQKITGLSAIQNYHPTSNGAALLTNNPSLAGNLYISAAQTMNLTGAIQGNQQTGTNDYAVSPDSGVNKAVANDAQKIRLRLTNNTAQESDNVAGIINLPTTSTPNNGNTQGTFALQLTGPVTEGKSAAGVSTKTLYSTSPLILSSDGNSVTLANGHTYYFDSTDKNTTTADDLVEASAVKDWSKIVGVVTVIPKLAAHDTADVILPVKDPTSADDAGKKVTIPTYFRAAGSFKNVYGSIVDSFETTAAIKNVDQDGNPINGFPGSTVSGLVDSTIANSAPTIPGYVFVNTEGPKTISLDTSNNVVINHYQVSKADLKSNDKVIEEATGDSAKNTGAATATGTNTITFTTTDADLAKGGSYTVTGPDSKTYATLADALKANSTFDQKSDATAPTQVFTVSYTKSNVNKGDVAVQGATKVYDGDASTDPVTYNVKLADGINAPTAGWVANDFDTSGIKSQDVGSYTITLSQQGLADLQKANASKNITMAAVTTGQFTITKAPITITAPSVTKVYDGKAYQGALTPAITGKPANGTDIQYTTTDISKDTDVGNYPINITATDADNPNYQITVKAGALTITPKDQTDAIVQNATKTYDGDASTDPTTYNVVLANGVKAPTWAADDFDTSGITSQNAGTYNVTLSAAGLKKLQDTNPNYKITNANVIGGTFTITPAQVTVNAPYLTKIYDGKAYSGDVKATVAGQPAKGDAVKYTLGDLSKDIDAGTYDVGVTANAKDNPNYVVTVNPGKLFITPKGTYTPVIVQGTQKVYDNDATTDPATYGVELPDGITAPKWSADDFNTTGITSQNAGSYSVTLSDKGIADLQAANPNYHLASISAGIFTITKAPITITVPSVTKDYDGKPYSDKINVDVSGKPAKGDDVNYQLNDLSNDTEPGTYDIDATANNNPNYNVTVKNGKLIINDKGATDNYTLTVNYVDGDDNNKTISTSTSTLKDGADYSTDAKVIDGYYLKTTPSNAKGTIDKSNVTVTYVYGENGKYIITPPDGGNPTDVVYPNDPKDPSKVVTPDKGIVPDKPGYTPVDPDGNPLKPVDPDDPTKGYLPPTVPSNPGTDTPIYYHKDGTADTYHVLVNYVDKNGNSVADSTTDPKAYAKGDQYKTSAKIVSGYHLVTTPSNASGTIDASGVTVNYIYAKNGDYIITPPDGGKATNVIYPNDPTDPSKADTPTSGIVPNQPGYTPVDPDGNPLKPVDPDDPTKGYLPPTVPNDPSQDTPISYKKNNTPSTDTYTVTANYVDQNGKQIADPAVVAKNAKDGDKYTSTAKVIDGYYLTATPSNASGTVAKGDVTINYVYNKIGSYIITPPDGGKTTNIVYPNDPKDPTKVDTPTSGIVPNKPGYTPVDGNGNDLKPVDPNDPSKGYLPPTVPSNPSQDTPIYYHKDGTADTYHVTVNYLDQAGNQIAGSTTDSKDYSVGDAYSTTPKVVDGYHLTNTPVNASGKMVKGGEVVNYIYAKNGSYIVTPPDGGKPTDIIYPNDPNDPKKADTPTDGVIPNVPGYHPTDDHGNPLTPVDPNDHSKGYLPPAVPDNPSDDTPIKYVPDTPATTNDNLTVNYVDESGNKVAGSLVQSYKDGASYSTSAKVISGYYLINTPSNASGTIVKGGNSVTYIYRAIGKYVITPPAGKGNITNVVYPNDPTNPREITTPNYGVVPYIPGYTPVDSKGNNLTPVDPNDLSKGYLPPAAPTAQPDLNTYITYKNTGSNNGGGSNNNGGGSNNNGGNSNNNGGSSNNGGGSSNNNGGTTPNGGNAGGNTTPSSNNNGGTSGKTTTGGDKVTKLTPTKGKTSGIVPTALTNRGNGTPTASNTGYNGYNGGGAVAGGSSNGGQMTNQATTGNGGGQSAGTAGTTQAAAGQTNANNGIQYPSSRLPQTGDAENKGTVILGVIGMLSTLGLAALRRKKREQD